MILAYVSPLPPLRTGVADYSAALLPHLRPLFDRIVAVVDGYVPANVDGLVDEVIDSSRRRDWWRDGRAVPLYHLGCNTRYHQYIYDALRRAPGVTVLHDGNLLPFARVDPLAIGLRAGTQCPSSKPVACIGFCLWFSGVTSKRKAGVPWCLVPLIAGRRLNSGSFS